MCKITKTIHRINKRRIRNNYLLSDYAAQITIINYSLWFLCQKSSDTYIKTAFYTHNIGQNIGEYTHHLRYMKRRCNEMIAKSQEKDKEYMAMIARIQERGLEPSNVSEIPFKYVNPQAYIRTLLFNLTAGLCKKIILEYSLHTIEIGNYIELNKLIPHLAHIEMYTDFIHVYTRYVKEELSALLPELEHRRLYIENFKLKMNI